MKSPLCYINKKTGEVYKMIWTSETYDERIHIICELIDRGQFLTAKDAISQLKKDGYDDFEERTRLLGLIEFHEYNLEDVERKDEKNT